MATDGWRSLNAWAPYLTAIGVALFGVTTWLTLTGQRIDLRPWPSLSRASGWAHWPVVWVVLAVAAGIALFLLLQRVLPSAAGWAVPGLLLLIVFALLRAATAPLTDYVLIYLGQRLNIWAVVAAVAAAALVLWQFPFLQASGLLGSPPSAGSDLFVAESSARESWAKVATLLGAVVGVFAIASEALDTSLEAQRGNEFKEAIVTLNTGTWGDRISASYTLQRLSAEAPRVYDERIDEVLVAFIRNNACAEQDMSVDSVIRPCTSDAIPVLGGTPSGTPTVVSLTSEQRREMVQSALSEIITNPGKIGASSCIDLSGIDLQDMRLARGSLGHLCLEGANLTGADLRGAVLGDADLRQANLTGANLEGVKFDQAQLSGANLTGANLEGVKFDQAQLSGANLTGANLEGVRFDQAQLSGANLTGANLQGANLDHVNLSQAFLVCARLRNASLEGANLSQASVVGANFENANLSHATLVRLQGGRVSNFPLETEYLQAVASGAGVDTGYPDIQITYLAKAILMQADCPKAAQGNTGAPLPTPTSVPGATLTPTPVPAPGAECVGCPPLAQLPETATPVAVRCDQCNTYVYYATFTGADFTGADLTGASLLGALLNGANFTSAMAVCADLRAPLVEANLDDVSLVGANLSGADLNGARVEHLNLTSVPVQFNPAWIPNVTELDRLRSSHDATKIALAAAITYGDTVNCQYDVTSAVVPYERTYRANFQGTDVSGIVGLSAEERQQLDAYSGVLPTPLPEEAAE